MPCPLCKENRADYSYSGADIFGDEVQIPGRSCGLCYEPEYPRNYFPRLEIRVCETCSAVWLMEYYYPDHPPLMIGGRVLKDPVERSATIKLILDIMGVNLLAGTMKQKEFDDSTACLSKLLTKD